MCPCVAVLHIAPLGASCQVQCRHCLQAEKRAAEASSQFQELYKKATSSWTPVWLQERLGKVKSHALVLSLVFMCTAIEPSAASSPQGCDLCCLHLNFAVTLVDKLLVDSLLARQAVCSVLWHHLHAS